MNDHFWLNGVQAETSVSIIMPTFNAHRTARRAVDSVVAQTHRHWQLVCVDDASADGTLDLLRAMSIELGDRVIIQSLKENGGPSRARNCGISLCSGTWVAILDADDAWRPDRLATLLSIAASNAADAICDNLMGYDDHLTAEVAPLFQTLPAALDLETTVTAEYQGRYNLGYLKPLVRRSYIEEKGIRYDEVLRTGEDLLFLMTVLIHGGYVACTDWPGYVYTTPVGDGSGRLSRSTTTAPRDLELCAALEAFATRHEAMLGPKERRALADRIDYLAAVAPLSRFRHARLNGNWGTALGLVLTEPEVRRRVCSVLWPGRSLFRTHHRGLS